MDVWFHGPRMAKNQRWGVFHPKNGCFSIKEVILSVNEIGIAPLEMAMNQRGIFGCATEPCAVFVLGIPSIWGWTSKNGISLTKGGHLLDLGTAE